MQSRTSKANFLILLLISILGVGCQDKPKEKKVEPRDYERDLVSCSIRLQSVASWREGFQKYVLFRNTSFQPYLEAMGRRIRGDRNDLLALTNYHKKATEQGISNEDQLRLNGKPLDTVSARISQLEKVVKIFSEWFQKDGTMFIDTWAAMLRANQLTTKLMQASIKDTEGFAALRDHSSRLKTARQYWVDELVNAMRGAKVDHQVVNIAIGSCKSISDSINPYLSKYNNAFTAHQGMSHTEKTIENRIEWAKKTLLLAPKEDPWRIKGEAKISQFEGELKVFKAATNKAMPNILDRSPAAKRSRSEISSAGQQLLQRINVTYLQHAQENGWPLPMHVSQ